MGRSGSRLRTPAAAIGAAAVAVGGTYLAERWTVARWSAAGDAYRDEPHSLAGSERWIDGADGLRLRMVEVGDGPTVVLAHGFTSTAEHWAPVASRLVDAGLRVVAFDQRGHGGSTSGNGRFRPSDLGEDLAVVIAETAPEGAVVVGHSMGGIGIQAMLADRADLSEHIRGLVLVATLARPVSVPLGKLMGRLGGTALARWTMANRVHGRILARGGLGAEPAVTILDVVRNGWATCSDDTRAGITRDLRDFDFTETLRSVEIPATVVCGDLDHVTPLDESRRIAVAMPNARLDVLPGVGHAATWEAADRVAEIAAAHANTQPLLGGQP